MRPRQWSGATARSGPNAGNDFWGCSAFPQCRGVKPMSAEGDGPNGRADRDQGTGTASSKPARQASSEAGSGERQGAQERDTGSTARRFNPRHRVPWRDATLTARNRQGWRAFYATVGASLRSIPDPRFAGLSNCWVARTERSSVRRPDTGERRVVETMRKLLARGTAPPLHPDAERDLLKARGLGSRIVKADAAGDMDPPTSLTSSDFTVPGGGEVSFDYGLARGDYSSSDLVQMTESNREREFVEWVAGRSAREPSLADTPTRARPPRGRG